MTNIKGRDSSQNNDDREKHYFKQFEGDVFLKYGDTPESTAIAIREKQIALNTKEGNVGVLIKDNGNILVQGKPVFKASGNNIIKGDFTENPQSSKMFTYTETIEMEATAKDAIYEAAGKLGVDLSETLSSGTVPLMTSISGYPPHNHQMMFKHVHAVEPTYLFRMPAVGMLDGIMDMLERFKNLF